MLPYFSCWFCLLLYPVLTLLTTTSFVHSEREIASAPMAAEGGDDTAVVTDDAEMKVHTKYVVYFFFFSFSLHCL